ncbi:testis-expressed protein 13D-like [Elephas maximus indicus]|uniref:testis-expressed protein 13D-like n=1 Tax=Elephas maximus indicus TaxID=99487 RepID=UPI002116A312|nr:testis-expressed protein 13D-like [Elephas maximus indicus]XP_049729185.1 testis-expressed protein 13D-like [Elephas maximus indicus]
MAVNFRDPRCGFRHSEVVEFINEEVLSNGGSPDFYVAYSWKPWNHVEDQLRAIVSDPRVPRTFKRACTWSALALSVRVVSRRRVLQERRVRHLQEQASQREAATWALASELQHLRKECVDIILQLRQTQADLQQSLDESEVLRGQLLQAKRSAQFDPQPEEVDRGSRAQQQCATAWPWHAEEQAVTEAETAAAVLSQMPPRMIYTPGVQAAAGSQKEMGPLWDQRSQGEEEGAVRSEEIDALVDSRGHGKQAATVRPKYINSSGHSWSQGDSRKQSQEPKTWPPKAPETLHDAEEAQASRM